MSKKFLFWWGGIHFPAFPHLHLPICRHLLSGGFLGTWPLWGSPAGDNQCLQQLPSLGNLAANSRPLNGKGNFCTFFILPAGINFSFLDPSGPLSNTHNSIFRANKRLSSRGIGHLHFPVSPAGTCFVAQNQEGIGQHLEARERKFSDCTAQWESIYSYFNINVSWLWSR